MRPSTIVCMDCDAKVRVQPTGRVPLRCKPCARKAADGARPVWNERPPRVVGNACPELARAVGLQRVAINTALIHLHEGNVELAKAVLRSVPPAVDLRVIDLRPVTE